MENNPEDTYRPLPTYTEEEKIAFDFGYKEGVLGGEFWSDYVASFLLRLAPHDLYQTEKIANAYMRGYHFGGILILEPDRHLQSTS